MANRPNKHPHPSPLRQKNLNDTRLVDPDLKRAQATLIVQQRLRGVPVSQLAKDFNLAEQTVAERIRFAKENGILQDIRQRVVEELLGPAVDALKMALADGNVEAAKAVLFGTGVLQKNPTRPQATVEMTLTEYRQQKAQDTIHVHQHQIQEREIPPELPGNDPSGRESEGDDPERE